MVGDGPVAVETLEVWIDHCQLLIYGEPEPGPDAFAAALDDAHTSGRFVGVAGCLVDLLSPTQRGQVPVVVEVWEHVPDDDLVNWDHVVDVDLDAPDGVLTSCPPGAATNLSGARSPQVPTGLVSLGEGMTTSTPIAWTPTACRSGLATRAGPRWGGRPGRGGPTSDEPRSHSAP